ncbi:MAG: hypothetical protein ACD_5C00206G0009 [uncultured bacterium]|nr:MAG: hypothetical protein ACD_5C00206G0009 [uncultured bacterium]
MYELKVSLNVKKGSNITNFEFKSMDYNQLLEKAKNKILNISKIQKISIFFLLLAIFGLGIYIYNPKKKLLEMRNSQRRSDVVNILNAVYKYEKDGGDISFIASTPTMVCRQEAISCEGFMNLNNIINKESEFLSEIPSDPNLEDQNSSGYLIWKSNNGRLNVSAPLAENRAVITLSK